MDITSIENTSVGQQLFAPLETLYPKSDKQYDCTSISDLKFAELGISRCLTASKTGHEFLQDHIQFTEDFIEVSHFFKAIKSSRRLTNLRSLNSLLGEFSKLVLPDAFKKCTELDNFDIYAGDGHYLQASCFDQPVIDKKRATGHFYRVDLRNHHMDYLSLEKPNKSKKKKHDTTVLKELVPEILRNGAAKGRKVIYCWDKASVDYKLWKNCKFNNGIYFITQEKANSAAEQISNNLHDVTDPRNEGVEADYLVGVAGQTMRRIIYTDPSDKKTYTYLTNELTLPAFALVLIYKHRWDIEKIFYQFKSKFNERKSWASSDVAKQAQAIFECLAHNLSLLLEHQIKKVEQIEDEIEQKKSEGRNKHIKNREGESKIPVPNYINTFMQRATHRTQRFIRWLRAQLYSKVLWPASMALLRMFWLKKST